jgi:hypothetical protein
MEAFMCDYSLETVQSRRARVGEKLVTTSFPGTFTRGFASPDEPGTAVCLLPGTELSFDRSIEHGGFLPRIIRRWRAAEKGRAVARFRRINEDFEHAHHDALEYADGRVIPLALLRPGQVATVLQLPADTGAREATPPAAVPSTLAHHS